jgi:hypothetical protein
MDQTKVGILQITILKIADIDFSNYRFLKKDNKKSVRKMLHRYEKMVAVKGRIYKNFIKFQTNNGHDYFSYFFDNFAKKYDLTMSIHHYYINDIDHHDVSDFFYVGRHREIYVLENFSMIRMDHHLKYSLSGHNAVEIKEMLDKIEEKIKELLKNQHI